MMRTVEKKTIRSIQAKILHGKEYHATVGTWKVGVTEMKILEQTFKKNGRHVPDKRCW